MRSESEREYVEYVTARLPRLHRAAYLLCGDRDRADDVVQATITSLYLHWRRARTAENLDGYVHRILVRRYLDERRRPWSGVVLTADAPERAAPAGHSIEERAEVVAALRQLPKGQRAVLVLRYFCDMSIEATATALGCSQGSVKSQSSRGLAALRHLLGSRLPTPQ
jgi:RNA polymerase sigma-70 factor (sigma-E family)